MAGSITFVNMNVWFGLDCRGIFKFGEYESSKRRQTRCQHLTDGLKDLKADVIAIQEANKLPAYVKKLSSALDYDAVWSVTNSGIRFLQFGIPTNFGAGNAILAKREYGLKDLGTGRLSGKGVQSKYFSVHFTEMRDVLAAMVIIHGRPLMVFNTQLHYSVVWNAMWQKSLNAMIDSYNLQMMEKEDVLKSIQKSHNRREAEISRLVYFVKKITRDYDCPYVIMGDFNTTATSAELKNLIGELDLLDAYRIKNPDKNGYTWDPGKNTNTAYDASVFWADGVTPKNPLNKLEAQFDQNMARRIDFIFLSSQFKPDMIQEARLIFTKPTDGLFTSDHFGLQVVLNQLP